MQGISTQVQNQLRNFQVIHVLLYMYDFPNYVCGSSQWCKKAS